MTRPSDRDIWRIEELPRPTEAHAADAVEMVAGEVVRRVSLPRFDYDVLCACRAWEVQNPKQPPVALELARLAQASVADTQAALRRLAAVGLIPPQGDATLQ